MRKIWRALGFVLIALACLLPALTFAKPPSHTVEAPVRTYSAAATVLRLAMPDASPTVDPALVADDLNVVLANLLYTGLVKLDPSYRVAPAAAARYTISPNHRVYTFYLRRDLRFSNGDPITASDFVYSLTRSLNPALKSPSAPAYLEDIQGASPYLSGNAKSVRGIKAINRLTLRITTRWPVPYFLTELTYPAGFALDRKRIAKLGPVDNFSWYSSPVASGPYRLKSWTPNEQMVLERNKHFWGPKPSVDKIVVSFTSFPSTGLYQYLLHKLDIANVPIFSRTLVQRPGIQVTQTLAIDGIYMNFAKNPFSNIHVRRALTLALNRNLLVARALHGAGVPFAGYVPPGQSGYDPHLVAAQHSSVLAQMELAAAGPGARKRLDNTTLYYPDDPSSARLAKAITRAWKRSLGIKIGSSALTVNTLLAQVGTGSLPLYLYGWSAEYPDGHDWLAQWETNAVNNNVHFRNQTFDNVVRTADATWASARRARLYDEAQQILENKAAWIPLYIPRRLVFIRPTVTNVVTTGYGLIPRGGTWSSVRMHTGHFAGRRGA